MSREQNNSLNLNTIDIFKKEKVRKEEEKELNIKTPKKNNIKIKYKIRRNQKY